ncbi:MAG TPA: hypothetical protein VG735_03720 [Caulobacterales bacterium]|nr:hypothetical protein [Caulobacterales bacterium]
MSKKRNSRAWRHAEAYFAVLCANAGATCNKAHQDEHGWDYFVEFPPAPDQRKPLDLLKPPVKCLVQIKSTTTTPSATKMKLSNALTLAKTEIPCFVAMFLYSGDEASPKAVVIHHFWEGEIRRTLKLARELDASGDDAPHKADFRLPFSSGSQLSPTDLLSELAKIVEAQGSTYGQKKRLFGETVGFEDEYASGNITYATGVTLDDIVDLHLGIKDELKTSKFRMVSKRFGIEAREPIADVTSEGTVRISATPRDCNLLLASKTSSARVKLPAKLFTPGIPDLPREKLKARVVCDFGEFIFLPEQGKIEYNFHLGLDEPSEPRRLLDLAELLSVCDGVAIDVQLMVDDCILLSGDGTVDKFIKTGPWLADIIEFLRHLISADANLQTACTFDSLLRNHDQLHAYMALICSTAPTTGSANFDWTAAPVLGPAVCYYLASAPFGDAVVASIVRRDVEVLPSDTDGRTPVKFGNVIFARPRIVARTHAASEQLAKEMERLSSADHALPVLAFGDLGLLAKEVDNG